MADFLAELKRRHIYRVAAAYAVIAWVLIQLIGNVAPMLRLPDWTGTLMLVLLLAGFPIAMLFAWMLDHNGSGEARPATGRLDWALIGALVAVLALIGYQQFAPNTSRATVQAAGVAAARQAAANPRGAISVAVLPFVNLSSDKEQEFFSDGMTEEITTALAKVPDLRVVARTSAFEFKGKNIGVEQIGAQLHATHVIEGSVRKAGNRLRITAQLIKADDGTHIWAEDYDRELTDVFTIQEDIARAITASLRVPLGLRQGQSLVSNRKIDAESYQQYLRAKALVRGRGLKPLTDAVAILEQVVARYPDYAPAWALLALDYDQTPRFYPEWIAGSTQELRKVADSNLPKAEAAAQTAIKLDPNLADGYISLGIAQHRRSRLTQADVTLSKALQLDASNPDALQAESNLLANGGYLGEAIAIKQRVIALEPFAPVFSATTGQVMWVAGLPGAESLIEKSNQNSVIKPMVYAAASRFSDAGDLLKQSLAGTAPAQTIDAAVRLLRMAPTRAVPPENLPRLGHLGFVYLYTGAPERALEVYERNVNAGYVFGADSGAVWHSSFAPVRKTERFKAYIRDSGILAYWRAKGWPDQCHSVGADDFACE